MVLCEIEKIWILNDLSFDGFLMISQLHTYFKQMDRKPSEYSERIFKRFDENNDGLFQKNEMTHFLKTVLETDEYELKYTPPQITEFFEDKHETPKKKSSSNLTQKWK